MSRDIRWSNISFTLHDHYFLQLQLPWPMLPPVAGESMASHGHCETCSACADFSSKTCLKFSHTYFRLQSTVICKLELCDGVYISVSTANSGTATEPQSLRAKPCVGFKKFKNREMDVAPPSSASSQPNLETASSEGTSSATSQQYACTRAMDEKGRLLSRDEMTSEQIARANDVYLQNLQDPLMTPSFFVPTCGPDTSAWRYSKRSKREETLLHCTFQDLVFM
jgi:hypothetical protein